MTATRIPAFFSHSYRPDDRTVNRFFWDLFFEQTFSFVVDAQSDGLSIPYMEFIIQRTPCFVSVVTARPEQ
jgi:hypothetical protein